MKSIVQYGAYPIVLLACMMGNVLLFREGAGFLVSTYVPVALGTLVVIALESRLPYRTTWRPSTEEVVQDSTFLALVHVVLPKMLSIAAAFMIFEVFEGQGWLTYTWWPKEWSVLSQTLLMVFLVDGMRYWLHRISHEWEPLWRFHAVHHSPHRLYTLNVGRFHPIDKTLQFLFEALPFICLGVKEDVLSLYFVWYAVNGFFQHSNVDVRLGVLNYVVSGPELHRWHHSMRKEEANHNYGNHLIVWDIVFGSRYLPPDREVEVLGLANRLYPGGFMDQMTAPYIPGIDKQTA